MAPSIIGGSQLGCSGTAGPSRSSPRRCTTSGSCLRGTWTPAASPSWPTPLKKRTARMPRSWPTAGGRGRTSAAAGWSTSSYQKTAKASACHCAAAPPTISVAALLRLAEWCQQRRLTQGGTASCPTPPTPVCPPVDGEPRTAAAPQGSVASTAASPATSTSSPAQRPAAAASPGGPFSGGDR